MTAVGRRRTAPDTPARPQRTAPSPTVLAMLAGLLYLPFVGLGYGTDIDVANIRRSGQSILDGEYLYSRPPGAFPHELITGLLDRLGGSTAVSLGSVVVAVLSLIALGRTVTRHTGHRGGRIAVILVATQPWFWVGGTSLGDYDYALAALLIGIDLAERNRRGWAAFVFGLAIGFRSATVFMVAAFLLAELLGDRDEAAPKRTTVLATGIGAAVWGLLWFIPPWLAADRTGAFLQNQLRAGDFSVMAARWGVKNIAFFGVATLVVLAVRAPVVWDAVARFRTDVLVRFAVICAFAVELVYLRFPWKIIHLLPVAVCVAILLAVSRRTSNRLVGTLVAANLLLAMVSVTIAEPDVADGATTGQFAPGWTTGVVVNEIDCRTDGALDTTGLDLDQPEAGARSFAAFVCQARSWRAGDSPAGEDGLTRP